MSETIILPSISPSDQQKIERLLDVADFPIYTEFNNQLDLLDYLEAEHWVQVNSEKTSCPFCGQVSSAIFHNNRLKWDACSSCYHLISDREFDAVHPGDDPVSLKIRAYFCEWIATGYYESCQVECYFGDYGITFNHCMLCNQTIDNITDQDVAIFPMFTYLVAHQKCADQEGFARLLPEKFYDEMIVSEIQERLACS